MTIIGIDPGMKGAVGIVDGSTVQVFDTPIIKGEGGEKNQYDLAGMVDILMRASKNVPCHVFIEKVNSFPGEGVTSSFNFGKGFGMWLGMIAALQLPSSLITPQRWKKIMMDGMGKEKSASRLRVQQLFPAHAHLFARVKDDGRAEAVLLAEYGRRQQLPIPQKDNSGDTYLMADSIF